MVTQQQRAFGVPELVVGTTCTRCTADTSRVLDGNAQLVFIKRSLPLRVGDRVRDLGVIDNVFDADQLDHAIRATSPQVSDDCVAGPVGGG